jgi:hypothetical protein
MKKNIIMSFVLTDKSVVLAWGYKSVEKNYSANPENQPVY